MFGWAITDGVVKAQGTMGAIVRFNLANYEPTRIDQIVLFNNVTNPPVSKPFTNGTTKQILYAYLDGVDVPDASYCLQENDLDIFLKTGVYDPLSVDISVAIFWDCNAQNVSDVSGKVDCYQEALALLKAEILSKTYADKNKPVPFAITNAIAFERTKLGL